ncbi:MAG: hypothetical protein CFE23_09125 [Flavobacterium sp. BFFFF1]|uniref:hypothetical protein n=1 Tax=Flavobacterium sp. BFFFF1 TaxID=2015557 RepID=UPI000BC3AEDA|nr:hypothetical protein [Flavobacterium sp. BFFFF1]OYU80409.1 MAG: hypothetical protein CFE23_09125 [Flavobacterium sp. BFFFF1]
MPKKEMIVPDFNFSYGYLKQLADSTLLLIDRDTVEFTDRGFTPAKRTQIVTALTNFSNFPTDEQINGLKITATATKDAARAAVEKQMRTFLLAAKAVFGTNTGSYREFGNADLTRQTDAELVRNAKVVVVTATKYLSNLAGEGITAAKITALDNARIVFDTAIDQQTQAVNNRDSSTEQRAILANALYALLVKYSDTGKDIWAEASEAKYNDYIIYNTVTGGPEEASGTAE